MQRLRLEIIESSHCALLKFPAFDRSRANAHNIRFPLIAIIFVPRHERTGLALTPAFVLTELSQISIRLQSQSIAKKNRNQGFPLRLTARPNCTRTAS